MLYQITELAQDDIDAAADGFDDLDKADSFVSNIHAEFSSIATSIGKGHRRADLTDHDVYFQTFQKRWSIIFKRERPITIVRVFPHKLLNPNPWFGPGFI